ncbi:XRE family transcriptional regulator [Pelagicoccus sp. SDUM812002]|uniref:helix-turn-helix domain-containing protein n=1 Tax=Pelagicoccus sp. SDUM812002 TaxID=3041266 RepID=UPI00280FDD6A|nr:XRE family transcriptional regulator [Pelagicoccus sp. SDUM812002]MDQ8183957.1 XRE family transcriptional regulator [Pelagicoccus sp. SDUM812002]
MSENDPKAIFAERLKQARAMSGLSLRKLEQAIGGVVSYNALSKYEKGEMMPNSDVLMAVSEATGQSYGFFFRPKHSEISDIKFRRLISQSGKKESVAIQQQATDFFERYFEILSILGINDAFKNPLGQRGIRTPGDAEKAADSLREKWKLGLNAIPNVHQMLEENNVKVYEVDAPLTHDGFSGWIDKHPVVGVAKHLNKQCLTRKRHTLLHELAHILFKDRLGEEVDESLEEKLAPRLAGALMLPADAFFKEFGKSRSSLSLTELIDVKVKYGISIASIMVRAHQLECISEAMYNRFWKTYKEENWKEGEPGDDEYVGDESSSRFKQLVYRALAEGEITRSKAAELLVVSVDEIRKEYAAFQ